VFFAVATWKKQKSNKERLGEMSEGASSLRSKHDQQKTHTQKKTAENGELLRRNLGKP
jgi:hypothetical protein